MTIDQLTDLKRYILSHKNMGSFAIFLVDREVVTAFERDSRQSVRDVVRDLIKQSNQENLFGVPKVSEYLILSASW